MTLLSFSFVSLLFGFAALFRFADRSTFWFSAVILACGTLLAVAFSGWSGAQVVFGLAGLLTILVFASYIFRAILTKLATREMAEAPLSAAFGMLVIAIYGLAAIFAPWIAPYGEAEIVASAFAPRSPELIFGADQLGRDVFS